MSGDVGSMPSLTRSGRPSFSFAASPPSGRTSTAWAARSCDIAGLDYSRPGPLQAKTRAPQAAAHPQAQTPRPTSRSRAAGLLRVRVRAAYGDLAEDPRARPGQAARHAGEHLRLRERRPHDPRDPARLAGAH